jgi:hypothetical protein
LVRGERVLPLADRPGAESDLVRRSGTDLDRRAVSGEKARRAASATATTATGTKGGAMATAVRAMGVIEVAIATGIEIVMTTGRGAATPI